MKKDKYTMNLEKDLIKAINGGKGMLERIAELEAKLDNENLKNLTSEQISMIVAMSTELKYWYSEIFE